MTAQPQPFDEGYDYEADKDIVERLDARAYRMVTEGDGGHELIHEAARTIETYRRLVTAANRRINSLRGELDELREPEDSQP